MFSLKLSSNTEIQQTTLHLLKMLPAHESFCPLQFKSNQRHFILNLFSFKSDTNCNDQQFIIPKQHDWLR